MEKKKLKIAIDTTYMDRRSAKGTAIFIRECVAQLVYYKQSLDVTLIHHEAIPEEPLYAEFKEIIIPKISLPRGSRLVSEFVFFLKFFLMRKEQFDIYYFAYSRLPQHFFLAPSRKIVSMQYDAGPESAGIALPNTKGKIRKWMLPLMRRYVDAFITTSQFGKEGLVQFHQLPKDKIHVVYGGADEQFKPVPRDIAKAYLKKEYGIQPHPFIIASGRLDPHKNILGLIEAYGILITKYHITQNLIITGGVHMPEYSEKVFQLIKERHLESRITILNVRKFEEMPIFYSAADVMVFPSFYEGFGLPLVEAMKCGIPTVASRGSSLTEVGGDATEFVDPTSASDIARGIHAVLSDTHYSQKLRERGLKHSEKFTWQNCTAQLVQIFQDV